MANSTVDKILDCAHRLLIHYGYNGFSYADIAQGVAISKPSIHHHFPAKVDLGVAVLRRYREQVNGMLASADQAGLGPRQQLEGYIDYWRQCIAQQDAPFCVCAMLAAEMPALPQPIRDEVEAHFRDIQAWLANIIQTGGADGSLQPQRQPEEQAAQVMALVHGAMLAARALDEPLFFDMLSKRMLTGLV
jgi:TetR/AcrR family transcriptional regulator, transcriptional repressor for nem operon